MALKKNPGTSAKDIPLLMLFKAHFSRHLNLARPCLIFSLLPEKVTSVLSLDRTN